ncbi:peptidase [Streptomyces lincolnensis]|uniref:Peptidase n=1 Tax=Streptomyces lincolnensis TaxID=1915 RepID=A0A1B1M613_STRLN|nr:site-2 protease family protein [Streptomyces lincolnensis]ANS64091.1 peptidase [Streptomyces lincolnensis]AXG57699.1 peptidase [Streptomyces lincolnensis]QMV05930.1 peptidase [Streptomyces lincolnensis]
MDESGGSGQPRSGNDEPTERHAAPATPATGPARPGPPPQGTDTGEAPPVDEPTMVVRKVDVPPETPDAGAGHGSSGGGPSDQGPSEEKTTPEHAAPEPAAPEGKAGEQPAGTEQHRHEAHTGHPEHPQPAGDRTLAHSGLAKGRPPRRERGPGGGLLMGRPFGVPVYVAPSWFLVAALITWVFGGQLDRVLPELGAARYLVSLFFAVAFYASVLVHELAHTVAALRFKLPVRRIQLQFFGGVSEIEKEAETPGREFWLAFVGPLLSLALSGLFYLAMQPVEPGTVPGVLLAGLMVSNLIVAAFNLLPGLPLDGGRMLRAVIWKITGKPMSGTVAAAWVGRALAVSVLIGLPLLTQSGALGSNAEDNVGMDTVMDALLAAILAAIIWTGAGNSLRMARLREHLPELRARTLTRRAVPVETDTPLSEALRRANAAGARALVVVDADGHPLSLVREAAIVGVPEHRRPWVAVSGLAQDLTDGMRVSAELAGEDLLDALRATPATEYLVVEDTGEIYGVLSAADVERAFVKAMARPS